MKKAIALCMCITCYIINAFVIDDFASGLASIKITKTMEEEIYTFIVEHADEITDFNNSSRLANLYNSSLKALILEALKDPAFNVNMDLPDVSHNQLINGKNAEITLKNLHLMAIALVCEDWQTIKKLLLRSADYTQVTKTEQTIAGEEISVSTFSDLNTIAKFAPLEILQVLNDLNVDLAALINGTDDMPLYTLLTRYAEQREPNEDALNQKAQESKQLRTIIITAIQTADKKNLNNPITLYSETIDATVETNLLDVATDKTTYCGHHIIKALLDGGVNPLSQVITASKKLHKSFLNTSLYNVWKRFIDFNDAADKEIILFILKNNMVEKSSILEASFDINENGSYTLDHYVLVQDLLTQTKNNDAKKEFEKLIK